MRRVHKESEYIDYMTKFQSILNELKGEIMTEELKPKKLECRDYPGHGLEIYADLTDEVNMVEFTTKKGYQPVMTMVSCAPWIQFEPKCWSNMMHKLFKQMVDAWNEKYAD